MDDSAPSSASAGHKRPKVLIVGCSGLIGRLAVQHLGHKYEFSGISRRPVPGIPHLAIDFSTSAAAIRPAFAGIDTVLHLAAASDADEAAVGEWPATLATIRGTANVYEAAHAAGVKRIVFFSSGHAQLGYLLDPDLPYAKIQLGPVDQIPASWPMIGLECPVRPDRFYALGALFGENMGRFYADKFGLSTLVVRSGAVLPGDRPEARSQFPGYLSQSDCVQLIDKCLQAPPSLRYNIFNAMSENKYRWRSTEHTKEVLGWRPTGTADIFPWP